jgi:hypothetical protein
MNTFTKKSLYAALAGIGALGAAGAAQAVSINDDGLGQVLLYPYFTVRSNSAGQAYQSLLSVVNTTNSAKAVKVRFLEGKNSREVLDFNLFLSKFDVWVAAAIPFGQGGGIFTPDKSCTVPTVSADPSNPTQFVNYAYTGSQDAVYFNTGLDGGDTGLDRTKEGYVEIIEMGNIYPFSDTYYTVTHAYGSVPGIPDCDPAILASPDGVSPSPTVSSNIRPGDGGLFGGITLINGGAGIDVSTEAIALANFSQNSLYFAEGSVNPNLQYVNPAVSVVVNNNNVYITDWTTIPNQPIDAVSAVFMRNNVYNEFLLDAATKSQTDWVVTFPTKWAYYSTQIVSSGKVVGVKVVGNLFQSNFTATGACDDVSLQRFDREEKTVKSQTTFSPPPPTQTDSICWEANVLTFNNSNLLASTNSYNIPTTFEHGWVDLGINKTSGGKHQLQNSKSTTIFDTNTASTTTSTTQTYIGLPVIGFAASTFRNDGLSTAGSVYYAGRQDHRFSRQINF